MSAAKLVAVTGGSGFIGSHVVDALRTAGHTVRVIDPAAPQRPDVEWRPVDILDTDLLARELRDMEAVFHLAAAADVNIIHADPRESVNLNVLGTASVLAVGTAALLVYLAERGGDGSIQTFADALWWAAATITTVGYGEIGRAHV